MHTSHYGRMCPIETPEGPNIGLIGALASYARVNDYGFIETPYRKVVNGRVTEKIVYLAADEEEEHVIAQANAGLDAKGNFLSDRVLVRRGPQGSTTRGTGSISYGTTSEVDFVPPAEVDLMDVSPKQIVSISTALIPFIEHDDANRALMGANMQKQAVPLVRPEAPYIGTGVEGRAAQDAGDVMMSEGKGTVTDVTGDHITVEYDTGQKDINSFELGRKVYRLNKFRRSNQNTCINQRPLVEEGQKVQKNDILADGPSTHNGELALGKNLLVAFMPWEGYNSRTPSSSRSDSSATTSSPRSTSRSTRSTPVTRSSAPRRSPRHPQPLRRHPEGPRRPRDHPHRRRGRPRRRARRQGHAQG